ncbi:MAG: hypothetical protein ACO3QC_05050 [Phycisphaerales bacterium]
MHAEAPPPSRLECPRCAYAVAATAQLADAGSEPRVVCSECGLASNLDELARGAACPPWLIESSAGRHGVVVRFLRTVTRAVAPHRFWSAVRLAAPISWRGIVAYLVGLALTLHLCAAAAITPIVLHQRNYAPATGSHIPDLALVAVLPLCPMRADDILMSAAQGNPNRSVDGAVLWRFATSAVRVTFARDKLFFESVPQHWSATGPYATKQPSPFALSGTSSLESDRNLLRAQRLLGAVLAVAAFPVVACASLALLRGPLRRARVRRSHLLRGCVYACAFAPIALALNAAAQWISVTAGFAIPGMYGAMRFVAIAFMLAIPVGAVAFSAIYLDAFCTRYLVLPYGRFIAILVNCVVLLAATGIGVGVWNA